MSQLVNTIKDKENALSILQVKMKVMETTILDLQEKINEKDQIIDAKNMATTLMSDSLSKKGLRFNLDLLFNSCFIKSYHVISVFFSFR